MMQCAPLMLVAMLAITFTPGCSAADKLFLVLIVFLFWPGDRR